MPIPSMAEMASIGAATRPKILCLGSLPDFEFRPFISVSSTKPGFFSLAGTNAIGLVWSGKGLGRYCDYARRRISRPVEALVHAYSEFSGERAQKLSAIGKSTNIAWHEFLVEKHQRQELLQQKGCVVWITGLSGSGKSTLACALSNGLHSRGKLTYVLDGDNLRHGLNSDLGFGTEDRAENIRRIGEVTRLFADAGVICIASLISPFRKDRDACRALFPDGNFFEVFLDVPLNICEARDPKGLYKLARNGKIRGFTGVDDPYEPPLNCEIVLQQMGGKCLSPSDMAETVISYLEDNGYLQA